MSVSVRDVDPGELRLPPSRLTGVDPWKYHQQVRQFGSSRTGMPPILVHEDPDGILEITDGDPGDSDREIGAGRYGPRRRDRTISSEPSRFTSREG